MTRIKICGITNKVDAIKAAELGVDMLGFVFYEKSKRYVTPRTVCDIVNELPPYITKVGIFVDEKKDKVIEIAGEASIDILQFHGSETQEYCSGVRNDFKIIKAFRVKDKADLKVVNDYDVDFYLFDTYAEESKGGTGKTFDWKILDGFEFLKPLILSGGLNPQNVGDAIRQVAPYGVDVSTGVEKLPGKKDHLLMARFVENVRKTG